MVLFIVAVGLLPFVTRAQGPAARASKSIPTPFETIKNSKQFNAARFGPGNSISFVQIPPDFQLDAFALSPSGRLLAEGWASGRIELWDLQTKLRVSEFKSGIGAPGVLQFNATEDQLIVAAHGGKMVFLEVPSGKKLRGWTIPLGKYKYDIQELVLDQQGKWIAYADEESSKVLDTAGDSPK
jgi:WD40 repeat protein